MEYSLVPNQLGKCNYNPILVEFNKKQKSNYQCVSVDTFELKYKLKVYYFSNRKRNLINIYSKRNILPKKEEPLKPIATMQIQITTYSNGILTRIASCSCQKHCLKKCQSSRIAMINSYTLI